MLTPKIPSFIKLPRHKEFQYKPMYYNEAKERLEERRKKLQVESNSTKTGEGSDNILLREKMREKWERNSYSKNISNSNWRIIIILVAILAIAYFIFK